MPAADWCWSPISLFEGTIEGNITLHRESVRFDDLQWALRFVELEEEVDTMPFGLQTPVDARGKSLPRVKSRGFSWRGRSSPSPGF